VKRAQLLSAAIALLVVALCVWIARNTHWEVDSERIPMSGEAAANDYYSLVHLAAALGIRTQSFDWQHGMPPTGAVLYVADVPPKDLPARRVRELEAWVQEGGRLVLATAPLLASKELQEWSEITPQRMQRFPAIAAPLGENCKPYHVAEAGVASGETLQICALGVDRHFSTPQLPEWSLADGGEPSVLRVRIGRGSVTEAGAAYWYGNRTILRGDFARLFFAAAALRHGDVLYWVKLTDAETLLAKLWRLAAPAMMVFALALALTIWRTAPRFGPMIPTPPPSRRSLAEQIRAHARFAWRTRRLEALRTAARRAVDEAARRCIPAYDRLSIAARIRALAGRSGMPAGQIETAMTHSAGAEAEVQRDSVACLQRLRRALENADAHSLTRIAYDR